MFFHVYVILLIFSGAVMLAMASSRASYARRRRVWNGILGAGFLIYGLYLLLFFSGGHYVLFYYAFALPVFLTYQFLRDRAAYKARQGRQQTATAYGAGTSGPGAAFAGGAQGQQGWNQGQPYPGQGQQGWSQGQQGWDQGQAGGSQGQQGWGQQGWDQGQPYSNPRNPQSY